ncbi:hypothetical protein [Pseudovibrio sp. Ad46]|uniref:hypothetical protein n=1 Tax=Pseudovibrio sp. Ad46 TaxID=989432 RepID=UPI0007AECECB|nr:hypothetical protein [Pseudovibrio sp. Ad46]
MTQNHKTHAVPVEQKKQATQRGNEAPAQTFANFTKALAGALVERRAAKSEGANSGRKNN